MSTISALRRTGTRYAVGQHGYRATALGRGQVHDLAAAALAALLVLSFALTDGGYYGTGYTELTVLLVASALLAIVGGIAARPSRASAATLGCVALLATWVALSALWAVPGAAISLEIRRSVLYLVALTTLLVVVDARRRLPALVGLLAAICIVGLVAIGMRIASGAPVDRLYGTLLEEPVGYPNALGVLAAIGALLAIGLVPLRTGGGLRALGAAGAFLVFVLGLTGSRGGALALCLGLAALAALSPAGSRRAIAHAAANAIVIGSSAWAYVQWRGAEGTTLAILAAATLALGWTGGRHPLRLRRRTVLTLACAVLVGAVAVLVFRPPSATTSYRTAYWRAALAETAEHPLLGSGAGSFYLSWREHRSVQLGVRDAHSLYVEMLSELGPMGLALVLTLVGVPLAVAVRRRGDPVAAVAGAGFVVFAAHTGVDWDWEMPVVTLAGLTCAGVLLAGTAGRRQLDIEATQRERREKPCP